MRTKSEATMRREFADSFYSLELPLGFAGVEVERDRILGLRANVNHAVVDHRRGFDDVTGFR